MTNGDIHRDNRLHRTVVSALALTVAGVLAACTPPAESSAGSPAAASSTAPSTAAVRHFGPDGYGRLTLAMSEKDALAGGELQTAPVSTVLGKNVYSFVGGPKPDQKRMAADEKIEKRVAKADSDKSDKSAAEYADDAQAYADSATRIADRLEAYLSAGGAAFRNGTLDSIAAPLGVTTEAGIKRGSTLTELKSAYAGQGLKSSSPTAYELPVAGHPGWTILFELKGSTVEYMSVGRAG
jgi:hypothetical protein